TREQQASVWDLQAEKPLPGTFAQLSARCAAWSPDGRFLAAATGDSVEVRRFPGGEVQARLKHPDKILALAYSRDGRFLAAAGLQVLVWDAANNRRPATAELTHSQAVLALSFNESGDRLATACADGRARIFAVPGSTEKPEPLFPPVPHRFQ